MGLETKADAKSGIKGTRATHEFGFHYNIAFTHLHSDNMKFLGTVSTALALISSASAHIEMKFPAPIKSSFNPNYDYTNIDYSMKNPLGVYPCKGYLDEPEQAVETFEAGKNYTLELEGSTFHDGGSCQLALSYDKGKSFTVIKSIIGGCPIKLNYGFEIPQSAPEGTALFAWSWINKIGAREYYQNCAWVDIKNNNPNATELEGPPLFVADVPGYCTVPEGTEFKYPDPGPNVEYGGDSSSYSSTCSNSTASA
jgi:hypothetical protein